MTVKQTPLQLIEEPISFFFSNKLDLIPNFILFLFLSRNTIFKWYKLNKNKIYYPWTDDLVSKRLINLLYNYEYINSSSTSTESKILNKIIFVHIQRSIFGFNQKKNK